MAQTKRRDRINTSKMRKFLTGLTRFIMAILIVPFILVIWVFIYTFNPRRFATLLQTTATHYSNRDYGRDAEG
jgi:hypothetical protein